MNFCPKCGQPIDQTTGLCPVCGDVSAPPERTIPESKGFAAVLKKKLGSPLLLWFCIIYTILTFITVGILGASFVGIKEADTSSVIAAIVSAVVSLAFLVIMLTAFWRVYFAAKSPEEEMRLGGLKTLSVIITIERVLVWIGTALILLFAALCFFAPSFVADTSNFSAEFAEIEGANIAISDTFPFYFSGIMMIIIAVLMILINIFYYGSIKKSIVSVIDSFKSDENRLRKLGAVKVWLIVIGILSALTILSYTGIFAMVFRGVGLPEELEAIIANYGSLINIVLIVAAVIAVLSLLLIFLGAALASRLNNLKGAGSPQSYIYAPNN